MTKRIKKLLVKAIIEEELKNNPNIEVVLINSKKYEQRDKCSVNEFIIDDYSLVKEVFNIYKDRADNSDVEPKPLPSSYELLITPIIKILMEDYD